jgi:serine/threonine protein kinase
MVDIDRKIDYDWRSCSRNEIHHSRGFVYRDLKPRNIRVDDEHNINISDFGTSRLVETYVTVMNNDGSPLYMAAEIAEGDYDYEDKVDVYSFGLILSEIFTGKGIFCNEEKELIEKCW